MKRTFAAVAAIATSTSMWLATVPADAKPAPKIDMATLNIMPRWTYLGGGKLAVTARCSERHDIRVLFSSLLRLPVIAPGHGNVLFRVTNKTSRGEYLIQLWCVSRKGQFDAATMKPVQISKWVRGLPPTPPLPRGFKPDLVVQTGVPQVIAFVPPALPARYQRSGHVR